MFGVAKAKFSLPKGDSNEADDATSVEVMFNPEQCVYTAGRVIERLPERDKSSANVSDSKNQPATLSLKLIFDTYESGLDVRKAYTDRLLRFMEPAEKAREDSGSSAQTVLFVWGKSWCFKGIITSMTQTFTLFHPNGCPARANVDLTMEHDGNEPLAPKDDMVGSVLKAVLWQLSAGQTLDFVASKVLGDTSKWRQIAQKNALDNVRDLLDGTMLEIDLE